LASRMRFLLVGEIARPRSTSRRELVGSLFPRVNNLDFSGNAPMPHVICEYSASLEKKIQIDTLLETLHAAMMRTGAAELAGLRTRADRRDHYRIADNDPANAFINVTMRDAEGPPSETRRRIAETVFADARKHLDTEYA